MVLFNMVKMMEICLLFFWIGEVNLKKYDNQSPWSSTFFEENCNDTQSIEYVANISKTVGSHLFPQNHCTRELSEDHPCLSRCDISNTTVLLYNKYTEAEENDSVNIAELNLLSEQIDGFKYVDKMLFTKLLYLLARIIDKTSTKIVYAFTEISRKLAYVKYPARLKYTNFFSKFLLTLKTDTTIVNRRFVLKVWNPFRNNITGISLYNHTSDLDLSVKYIFKNQSSKDIDVDDLQIAGYIPYEILSELVRDVEVKVKDEFRVVMLLVVDDPEIRSLLKQPDDLKYFIGIAVRGYCKMNELPLLTAFFKPLNGSDVGHWIEFGKNYFDSLRFPPEYCILNGLSFFGSTTDNADRYYESSAEEYCLSVTTVVNNSTIVWDQTPVTHLMYPRDFCITRNLNIPIWYCSERHSPKSGFAGIEDFECVDDLSISNNTENLFRSLTSCFYGKESCEDQIIESFFNFIDAKLYLQFLINMYYGPERLTKIYEAVEKSLVLLEAERNRYPQITYLSLLMFEIIRLNPFAIDQRISIKSDHYIYETFPTQHTNANGVALHKQVNDSFLDYKVKLLTTEDEDLSYNNNVEVVIKFSKSTKQKFPDEYLEFHYFVIYNNSFTENDNFLCKSRIVGIYLPYNEEVEFDIYLKSIDSWSTWSTSYDNTENYSTKIKVQEFNLVVFCVSVPKDDPCDSSSKLFILRMPIYNSPRKGFEIDVRNRTVEKIDILSQLAMSLNPGSRKMHEKHSAIFKIVTRICCILSSIGFFCIFISSLLLKGWYKRRMNTIQLSIAETFQIVFILIEHSDISHIGYLLFYYSILSQFSWMSIIGYLQYLKFVKIFGDSELTTTKSIILGWLVPAVIVLTSMLFYMDCFKCNLCYKNDTIFTYFVIVPISLVIVGNFAVYIAVMASILRSKSRPKMRKTVLRAAVLLPFVMGISWIFIAALVTPWSWITLTGSYLFHTVASLQGFILFVFTVVLDKDTRSRWCGIMFLILRRKYTANVKR